MTTPRIPATSPAEFDQCQIKIFAEFVEDGKIFNALGTMANHPDLASSWLSLASYTFSEVKLPPADREKIILRTGWLAQCEYEWGQHVLIAQKLGLSNQEIESIKQGCATEENSDFEQLLMQATDELYHQSTLNDQLWQNLSSTYSTQQMMDLVFLVGSYKMLAMALNSFAVQLDEGLPGF